MKAIFAFLLFLSTATIALGQAIPDVDLGNMTVSAPGPDKPAILNNPTVSALADCAQSAVKDITPAKLMIAYPVILVVLRLLSELLGKMAAAGSGTAATAVVGLRYAMSLLAWFVGKGGLGTPKQEMAKHLPKLKEMKVKAKEKAAAKAA